MVTVCLHVRFIIILFFGTFGFYWDTTIVWWDSYFEGVRPIMSNIIHVRSVTAHKKWGNSELPSHHACLTSRSTTPTPERRITPAASAGNAWARPRRSTDTCWFTAASDPTNATSAARPSPPTATCTGDQSTHTHTHVLLPAGQSETSTSFNSLKC